MPFFILRKEKIKKMFKTNCKCPRCGEILYTQTEYGDYSYQCQNCDEDFYDFEVTNTEGSEDTHNVFVPVECMAAEYPIEDQCYIIPIQEFRALENVKSITE